VIYFTFLYRFNFRKSPINHFAHTIAIAAVLLFQLAISPTWAAEEDALTEVEISHLLDDRHFYGQNGSVGESADHDNEIIFENGTFHSISCDAYGFEANGYRAVRDGDKIHFQATIFSKDHGKMVFAGTVSDNQLKADFVWTKERWYWNTRREYWFTGAER